MYTVIEALTRDGRDLSLDYKISGLFVPRGSWDAKVLDAIAPADDEIVLPKTSSSVFISTNIDYVLRNLGVRSLIIAGVLTDQCIDSAVRDACDLGYLVTVPTDACATLSAERHEWSLRNNRGYCRQVTTDALVREIDSDHLSLRGAQRRSNLHVVSRAVSARRCPRNARLSFGGGDGANVRRAPCMTNVTRPNVCFARSISARRYASPSSGHRSTPIRAR